jgi:hypothetical protein
MVKEVPRLRIDGIWSSALDGEHVGHSVRGVDAPHTGAYVRVEPFATTPGAAWGASDVYVGVTRLVQ